MYPVKSNFNTREAGVYILSKCNNVRGKTGMRKHERKAENTKYMSSNTHI